MKSQVELAVPGLRLGLELLRAVLAHDRDAGLGEDAELLDRDVLDRREDLDVSSPDLGRARARGCRRRGARRARGSAPPRDPRLAAGQAAVAAVGEEALASQTVHRPQSWISVDARRLAGARGRPP